MHIDTDKFHRDGYLHIPGVLDEQDLEPLADEYGAALRNRVAAWTAEGRLANGSYDRSSTFVEDLLRVSAMEGFEAALLAELDITLPHLPFSVIGSNDRFHLGPALLGLMTNPKLLAVVQAFLGPEITASGNGHCRLKLPTGSQSQTNGGLGASAPTQWHQDAVTQVPDSDRSNILTCWIAMVDVGEENGCLRVVPRRHHELDLLAWPLAPATVAELEQTSIPVPVAKGDVILMDKRTPHASLPNRSSQVRWSLDLRFHPSGQPNDRPWFPAIKVCSSQPGFAVADASEWCRQWELARSALMAARQPLPGRASWARSFAESLIDRWDRGEYLRVPA
jgi:hypothetical protein